MRKQPLCVMHLSGHTRRCEGRMSNEFDNCLGSHSRYARLRFDLPIYQMPTLIRHTSKDGQLTLSVHVGADGETSVGFEGGDWHTHPDLLAAMLQVPDRKAVAEFVSRLQADEIPIVISTDGGVTFAPWVSDHLDATLAMFGSECLIRYWSGIEVVKKAT